MLPNIRRKMLIRTIGAALSLVFLAQIVMAENVAVIISGIAGDKKFYNKFWDESSKLYYNLIDYGFPENNIIFLFEDQGYKKEIVDYDSRFKNIKFVMNDMTNKLKPEDILFVFLIGHASKDYDTLKFHLRGPDMTPEHLKEMLDILPVQNICSFIFLPYSAKFIPFLSRKNRVIITSSDKHEKNQPFFLEEFNKTLIELRGLANKTDRISLYQLFQQTQLMVSGRYASEGLVKTEHAQVDSDGDGIGHNDISKEDTHKLKSVYLTPALKQAESPVNYKPVISENIRKPGTKSETDISDTILRYINSAPPYEKYKKEAVYLYRGIEKDINEDGLARVTVHHLIKIYNEGGRHYAEVEIPSGYGEAPEILLARTFKPDGTIIPVDFHSLLKARKETLSAAERDVLYMKFSMPGITDGCVIEYKYRLKKPGFYTSAGSLTAFENLQQEIPVLHSRYVLSIPRSSKIEIIPKNLEIDIKHSEKRYDKAFIITAQNIPARPVEIFAPHPVDSMKGFIIAGKKETWEGISNWFYNLAIPQMDADTAIKEKVSELTRDAPDTETRIRRIYDYVSKEIRYVAIELGIHGYKPHYAPSTLKNRYGDCKDKATLFITMLKTAGIKSYPALLNAGGAKVDFRYPFLGAFNHCITAIPGAEGKLRFFDVTPPASPYDYLPYYDQGRQSLVVMDKKGKFIKTPVEPPGKSRSRIELELEKAEDNFAFIRARVILTGAYAADIRNQLIEAGSEVKKNLVKRFLSSYEPKAILSDYRFENLGDISDPLRGEFSYQAPWLENTAGDITIVNVNLPEFVFSNIQKEKSRHTDIYLPYNVNDEVVYRMKVPPGKKIQNLGEKKYTGNGYSSIFTLSKNKGGILTKSVIIKTDKTKFKKEEFESIKKFLNDIYRFKKEPIIFIGSEK